MLFHVPRSRFSLGWPATVTRPDLTGCLNCRWLPSWLTCSQPSRRNRLSTARTFGPVGIVASRLACSRSHTLRRHMPPVNVRISVIGGRSVEQVAEVAAVVLEYFRQSRRRLLESLAAAAEAPLR